MDDASRVILDRLHLLSGQQFERLCGHLFEAIGYSVKHTPASGDRGIDLELTKEGRVVLVQCKRQQSSVGEPAVRDFFGVVTHRGADKGIFCTNGAFSARAENWAAGTRIELLDGAELVKLWRQYAIDVPVPEVSVASPQTIGQPRRSRPSVSLGGNLDAAGVSKGVIKRRENADRKWVAAKCDGLGIPRPTGPTDYSSVDGDYQRKLFIGPDGSGEYVVVHDGTVLHRSSTRRSAMDHYDRIKLDY
ncbi:MAG: restriction endonuclease [Coriobacteriia bacterium]|nr:restriction endonuclease [Coriobacteriia bacterium]